MPHPPFQLNRISCAVGPWPNFYLNIKAAADFYFYLYVLHLEKLGIAPERASQTCPQRPLIFLVDKRDCLHVYETSCLLRTALCWEVSIECCSKLPMNCCCGDARCL